MKDDGAVIRELKQIIASKTKLEAEAVDLQMNLEESGLDSFARIELVLLIEDQFGFEMSDSESADLTTVDDVVRLILVKQGAAA